MKTISLLGAGEVLLSLIPLIFKSASFESVKVGYSDRHANEILASGLTYRDTLLSLQQSYPNLFLYELNSLDDESYSDICLSDIQLSWFSLDFRKRHNDKAPFLYLSLH